jgi:hypothetical protein
MPDYENDIVFKPELSWEELCEWAVKELNAMEFFSVMTGSKKFLWRGLEFSDIGIIKQSNGCLLAKNKTPEQMKTIIQALYEE